MPDGTEKDVRNVVDLVLQCSDITKELVQQAMRDYLQQNQDKSTHGKTSLRKLAEQSNGNLDSIEVSSANLQDFKETLPLLPSDADDVKAEVNKRVIDCLGGKNSNAYHDSSIRGKVYSDIYRELKRQFEVSKYNCIHRNQKNIAIEIVRNYEPPYVLAEEIKDSNAQLNLEDVDGV